MVRSSVPKSGLSWSGMVTYVKPPSSGAPRTAPGGGWVAPPGAGRVAALVDDAVERLDAGLRRTTVNAVENWIVSRGRIPRLWAGGCGRGASEARAMKLQPTHGGNTDVSGFEAGRVRGVVNPSRPPQTAMAAIGLAESALSHAFGISAIWVDGANGAGAFLFEGASERVWSCRTNPLCGHGSRRMRTDPVPKTTFRICRTACPVHSAPLT